MKPNPLSATYQGGAPELPSTVSNETSQPSATPVAAVVSQRPLQFTPDLSVASKVSGSTAAKNGNSTMPRSGHRTVFIVSFALLLGGGVTFVFGIAASGGFTPPRWSLALPELGILVMILGGITFGFASISAITACLSHSFSTAKPKNESLRSTDDRLSDSSIQDAP